MTTMRRFDGPAYIPENDDQRLLTQIQKVWNCMLDGEWRTHAQVSELTGAPQPSVLAQFGHLRKARFGGHAVQRRATDVPGLYEYRLIPNGPLLDGTGIPSAPSMARLREEVVEAACEFMDNPSTDSAVVLRDAVRRMREAFQ